MPAHFAGDTQSANRSLSRAGIEFEIQNQA